MEIVLHLLAERTRPDDAKIELGVLQHPAAGFLKQAGADIEPSRIGAVVQIGRPDCQIFGREDALAEKDGGAARAAGLKGWSDAAEGLKGVVAQTVRRTGSGEKI